MPELRRPTVSRDFRELAARVESRGHRLLLYASSAKRDTAGCLVEDGQLTTLAIEAPGGAILARTFFCPGQTPEGAAATLLRRY